MEAERFGCDSLKPVTNVFNIITKMISTVQRLFIIGRSEKATFQLEAPMVS